MTGIINFFLKRMGQNLHLRNIKSLFSPFEKIFEIVKITVVVFCTTLKYLLDIQFIGLKT